MASEEITASPVILRKRTALQKHRVQSQSIDATIIDDLHQRSKTPTGRNRSVPRPTKVIPKAEAIPFKRCQSQQKDAHRSSPTKLERQLTTITYQTRLPTFPTSTDNNEQKQTSQFRRRQIYALNHLMRDFEQEKFREFCKLHNIGTDNDKQTNNTNNESST
ncbi:hypothetical protein I4U23_021019 [Adineta vaga]|nr:hypothetical protein I4U23_021019 [Adineta vaga]